MQENKLDAESKRLLGSILARTFEVEQEHPFEDLLGLLNKVNRVEALDEADRRVSRLLHGSANTALQ